MAFKPIFRFRNPDSTQDLNSAYSSAIDKGIYSGGDVSVSTANLNITVAPFTAVGFDGLVVKSDAPISLSAVNGKVNVVALFAKYERNAEPIMQLQVYEEASITGSLYQDFYIIFGRVDLTAGGYTGLIYESSSAPPSGVAAFSFSTSHYATKVGRFGIKQAAANVSALPLAKNSDGDLRYAIAEKSIYSWDSSTKTWVNIIATDAVDVAYSGGPAWADASTNPATSVESQLDKIVTDLGSGSGSSKIAIPLIAGAPVALAAGTLTQGLTNLVTAINNRGVLGDTNVWTQPNTFSDVVDLTGVTTITDLTVTDLVVTNPVASIEIDDLEVNNYAQFDAGANIEEVVVTAAITANQNDYSPTNFSTASLLRVSTDTSRNITGFSSAVISVRKTILNSGNNPIVLKNQDGASSATNRISAPGGADFILNPSEAALLIYDEFASCWVIQSKLDSTHSIQASLASNQNDYAPTGWSTASVVYLLPSASINITGFSSNALIKRKLLVALPTSSSYTVTLKENSNSSSASNRIRTTINDDDYILQDKDAIEICYDEVNLRWRVIPNSINRSEAITWLGNHTFSSNIYATEFQHTTPKTLTLDITNTGKSDIIGGTGGWDFAAGFENRWTCTVAGISLNFPLRGILPKDSGTFVTPTTISILLDPASGNVTASLLYWSGGVLTAIGSDTTSGGSQQTLEITASETVISPTKEYFIRIGSVTDGHVVKKVEISFSYQNLS